MCPPFVSLLVSALFRWPCSISIDLSPRSVTAGVRPFPLATQHFFHLSPRSVAAGVRPFPLAMQHVYSFVSQVCHWWCPPFSASHAAFLFICLPGVLPLAMQHFYSFFPGLLLLVSALFRWPCNICRSVICLPGLSLVVSSLFGWPCSLSIHLSRRSVYVPAGVRRFPLAM